MDTVLKDEVGLDDHHRPDRTRLVEVGHQELRGKEPLVRTEVPATCGEVKFDSGVFARQDVDEEGVGAGPTGKDGQDGEGEKRAKHERLFRGV